MWCNGVTTHLLLSPQATFYILLTEILFFSPIVRCLTGGDRLGLTTTAVGSGVKLGRLLLAILDNALEFLADLLDSSSAGSTDSSNITVVGVDTDKSRFNGLCLDVLDNDVSWATVLAAVTAAAEELADIDDSVVLDGDSSSSVMLDNLVNCVLSSTSLDQNASSALESDGI